MPSPVPGAIGASVLTVTDWVDGKPSSHPSERHTFGVSVGAMPTVQDDPMTSPERTLTVAEALSIGMDQRSPVTFHETSKKPSSSPRKRKMPPCTVYSITYSCTPPIVRSA